MGSNKEKIWVSGIYIGTPVTTLRGYSDATPRITERVVGFGGRNTKQEMRNSEKIV